MASDYGWGINPFQDFLFETLQSDIDISDEEMEADIYIGFTTILQYFKNNEKYENYLDYEIKKNDICFKIVANNALTALWLSGIIPINPENVIIENKFEIGDRLYRFNEKTKRLTYRELKKGNLN